MRKLRKRKLTLEDFSVLFKTLGATLVFVALIFFADLCIGNAAGFDLNHRAVFGLIGNNDIAIMISTISLVVLGIQVLYEKEYCLFAMTLAGALSNLLQRMVYGGVPDYIELGSWPPFNIADIIIVLSLILITIRLIKKNHPA